MPVPIIALSNCVCTTKRVVGAFPVKPRAWSCFVWVGEARRLTLESMKVWHQNIIWKGSFAVVCSPHLFTEISLLVHSRRIVLKVTKRHQLSSPTSSELTIIRCSLFLQGNRALGISLVNMKTPSEKKERKKKNKPRVPKTRKRERVERETKKKRPVERFNIPPVPSFSLYLTSLERNQSLKNRHTHKRLVSFPLWNWNIYWRLFGEHRETISLVKENKRVNFPFVFLFFTLLATLTKRER